MPSWWSATSRLHGLVTDRDLVVRAVAESKGPEEPVGPLSTGNLIGVNADDDAEVAARLMREHAVRRLPVIDNGQVAGMVSLGDRPPGPLAPWPLVSIGDLALERDERSALAGLSAAPPYA